MEHRKALLDLLLCALRCETLSLTPFRQTDRPLCVTTSADRSSAKPGKEAGMNLAVNIINYVLSALSPSQTFCLVGTKVYSKYTLTTLLITKVCVRLRHYRVFSLLS